MREIKFRAKTIFGAGEWVYGYYAVNEGKHYIYENDGPTLIVPETVGDYTGLKDATGREIYEGDIIEVAAWRNERFAVVFEAGMFRAIDGERKISLATFIGEVGCRVISNIYENSDLL